MTKLAPEWVRTSDPVIRSPARYRWTTAPARFEREATLKVCCPKVILVEPSMKLYTILITLITIFISPIIQQAFHPINSQHSKRPSVYCHPQSFPSRVHNKNTSSSLPGNKRIRNIQLCYCIPTNTNCHKWCPDPGNYVVCSSLSMYVKSLACHSFSKLWEYSTKP